MNQWLLAVCALALLAVYNTAELILKLSALRHFDGPVDDSTFTYVDADFPTEVPLRLDAAALTHKWHSDLSTYDITSDDAWDSLFPIGNGWVSLGPGTPKRKFAMTMYHQLHCLNALRTSYLTARAGFPENATFPDTSKMADYHFRHCLNYLREMVLCAADTTLEYPEMDITHRCRDWTQLRQWVESNYEEFDVRAKADSMIVEE